MSQERVLCLSPRSDPTSAVQPWLPGHGGIFPGAPGPTTLLSTPIDSQDRAQRCRGRPPGPALLRLWSDHLQALPALRSKQAPPSPFPADHLDPAPPGGWEGRRGGWSPGCWAPAGFHPSSSTWTLPPCWGSSGACPPHPRAVTQTRSAALPSPPRHPRVPSALCTGVRSSGPSARGPGGASDALHPTEV